MPGIPDLRPELPATQRCWCWNRRTVPSPGEDSADQKGGSLALPGRPRTKAGVPGQRPPGNAKGMPANFQARPDKYLYPLAGSSPWICFCQRPEAQESLCQEAASVGKTASPPKVPGLSVCLFIYLFIYLLIYLFLLFFGPHLRHMEVPRLGVQFKLQLLAYTIATAIRDPSCTCNLHHSSRQGQITDPLSKAKDWTRVVTDTSRVRFHWATTGTPKQANGLWS